MYGIMCETYATRERDITRTSLMDLAEPSSWRGGGGATRSIGSRARGGFPAGRFRDLRPASMRRVRGEREEGKREREAKTDVYVDRGKRQAEMRG